MPFTRRRRRNYVSSGGGGGIRPSLNTYTNLWQPDGGTVGGGAGFAYASGTKLVIPSGITNPCLVLFLHSYHAVGAGGVRLDTSTGAAFTQVIVTESAQNGQRSAIYVIPAPTTDGVTSHTIWVDSDYKLGGAILAVYQDVHQTVPFGVGAGVNSNADNINPYSVNPASNANDLVLAVIGTSSLTGVTQDGTLTNTAGGPYSNGQVLQAFFKNGVSPSTEIKFTSDGSHYVALSAAALKSA